MNKTLIDTVKEMAIGIFGKGVDTKRSMDEISEWDSVPEVMDNIEAVVQFLAYVAGAVKKAAEELLETVSNEEKLAAAVEVVKDLLKLPAWVEFAGGVLLRWAISAAYQAYVKGR